MQPRHDQLGIDLERPTQPLDGDVVTPALHLEQTREEDQPAISGWSALAFWYAAAAASSNP